MREYHSIGTMGATAGIFAANNSGVNPTYWIATIKEKFSNLPDFTEFKSLFREFKITGMQHTITPAYKDNVLPTSASQGVPNFEAYIIPVGDQATQFTLPTATNLAIDQFLDSTIRKKRIMFPGRGRTITTQYPKVIKNSVATAKASTTEVFTVANPPWLDCNDSFDDIDVEHYGFIIIIRRVDKAILDPVQNPMVFDVTHRVFFTTRKVQ